MRRSATKKGISRALAGTEVRVRSAQLIDVHCNDRLAEQVTGAYGYGPQWGAGVKKPRSDAPRVNQRVIEFYASVEVSLYAYDDALPRHVFQTHANRPTVAPIGEFGQLVCSQVYCARVHSHASPAGLAIEHRAVPSITKLADDGSDLVDADRTIVFQTLDTRLILPEFGPGISALHAENH